MNFNIKRKIKEKKGISMIITIVFLTIMSLILIFVIDVGREYVYKQELQRVADSIALGGSKYGIQSYINNYNGAKVDFTIDKSRAISKANDLLRRNKDKASQDLNISYVNYNLSNNISAKDENDLYNSGIFIVQIKGDFHKIFGGNNVTLSATSAVKTNTSGNAYETHTETKKVYDYSTTETVHDYYELKIYDYNNNLIKDILIYNK